MQHKGLLPIIVCSNDDPGVTLTYLMARSNLVTYAFHLFTAVKYCCILHGRVCVMLGNTASKR